MKPITKRTLVAAAIAALTAFIAYFLDSCKAPTYFKQTTEWNQYGDSIRH